MLHVRRVVRHAGDRAHSGADPPEHPGPLTPHTPSPRMATPSPSPACRRVRTSTHSRADATTTSTVTIMNAMRHDRVEPVVEDEPRAARGVASTPVGHLARRCAPRGPGSRAAGRPRRSSASRRSASRSAPRPAAAASPRRSAPCPLLMRIVVPTHSATAASSWLLMPNSGHSELMPPSGSMHALHQEVAPRRHDQRRGEHGARIPRGPAERRPDVADQLLQHEAADPRAGVDRRQDEQRLEHDGEVIPERHQPAGRRRRSGCAPCRPRATARRRCGRAASSRRPRAASACDLLRRHREAPAADHLRRGLRRAAQRRRAGR